MIINKNLNRIWKSNKKKILFLFLIFLIFVYFIVDHALYTYSTWRIKELPVDEKMITHFEQHRTEIENLVRLYQSYSYQEWEKNEVEIKELMDKAGVSEIFRCSGTGEYWLPNPYSPETAKLASMIIAKDFPQGFSSRNTSIICITLSPQNDYLFVKLKSIWRDYDEITKRLEYFPYPPKIIDRRVKGILQPSGYYSLSRRVLTSLDYFPSQWRRYETVYRQINSQWFISLRNGSSQERMHFQLQGW